MFASQVVLKVPKLALVVEQMAKGFSMSGDNWCWFDYWQLHPDLLLEENSLRLFNHTRCQIGKRLEQITTVELDYMLSQACQEIRGYLKHNAEEADRTLCDGIPLVEEETELAR